MKSIVAWTAALAVAFTLSGCAPNPTASETDLVAQQDKAYLTAQPPPRFEWSLERQLWIDFYASANEAVTTWSYIQPITGGRPLFETASQGYPIPFDTQLTNPLKHCSAWNSDTAVIEQAEPNGLYTSKNSDATIVMAANRDGTLSPIYTEQKVTAFSFPVRWVDDHFERVLGAEPSIKLNVRARPTAEKPEAP